MCVYIVALPCILLQVSMIAIRLLCFEAARTHMVKVIRSYIVSGYYSYDYTFFFFFYSKIWEIKLLHGGHYNAHYNFTILVNVLVMEDFYNATIAFVLMLREARFFKNTF